MTILLTDTFTVGAISASYEYGPFGETLRATGPLTKANQLHFSTKYQDDETDLLCYNYRYYNPSAGRWLNRDCYREVGFDMIRNGAHPQNGGFAVIGDRSNPNVFEFLKNAPTSDFDPYGLCGGDGSQNCKCGPDVTQLVYQTLNNIADAYGNASNWKKLRADIDMFGPESFDGWDINYLHLYKGWPDTGSGIACQTCSSNTYTFEGMCVRGEEVNYIMFGRGILLCDEDPQTQINTLFIALVIRYELGNPGYDTPGSIIRKTGFAMYGAGMFGTLPTMLKWPGPCAPRRDKYRGNDGYPENWYWPPLSYLHYK